MLNNNKNGILFLVGLGLNGKNDMTMKGFNVLENSDLVLGEFYTSSLGYNFSINDLEEEINKEINVLSRDQVESGIKEILREHKNDKVAFVTAGDPMVATTHTDLRIRAIELGMETEVIHAPSIYSAIAETGLQIYKFGKSTSVVFPDEERNYFPTSYYDVIKQNIENNLHSMIFLDINSEEDRYMRVSDSVDILLKAEKHKNEEILGMDTLAIGVARIGSEDPMIKAGYFRDLKELDFGNPPHTLVIPGDLHHMEKEYLVKVCDGPQDLLDD